MTLFFLLNPKQFLLPTTAGPEGDPYRKRRIVKEDDVLLLQTEQVINEVLPENIEESYPISNPEIQKDIAEYLVLSRQLEEAKQEEVRAQMKARQEELARQILEMHEEEEAIIMLLFN